MQLTKRMSYEPDPNKFDTRTHHWDAQGALTKTNLYTLHVVSGSSFFERPINSGNLWYENNQPAGRVTYKDGVKTIDEKAEHIAFVPKLEGAEAVYAELEAYKAKASVAEAELAAIRAEREPKASSGGGTGQPGSITPSLNKKDKA